MKYLLLIYSNPTSWAHLSRHMEQSMREHYAINAELVESGEGVGGAALADPVNTRTIKVRDGVATVTDGPYLEAKEHLAGYYLVECDSQQRAIEIAARIPDAKYNAVEVRPVMNPNGMEM